MSKSIPVRNASEFQTLRDTLLSSPPGQWESDFITYRSKTGRYFFHVQLDQSLTILALFDPGAEVSLLNKSVYDKWPGRLKFPATPAPGSLTGAFGNPSEVTRKCRIPIAAMGQRHLTQVYVTPNLSTDFIAGSDFIDRFGISLNAKKRRLECEENLEVVSIHGQRLEPFEVQLVECKLKPHRGKMPKHIVVESPLEPGSPLLVPPGLVRDVSEGGTFSIPVWNWSATPLDTREVCSVVAAARPAEKAVPLNELVVGELPMPPLTAVTEEKKKYLLKHMDVGKQVTPETKKKLEDLILKYHKAFGAHKYDLGRTQTYTHQLRLKNPDQQPIFQRQFRLPDEHQKAAIKEVEEMLKLGVLRPSSSQWNSSIFLVPKGSGGWRIVQDFRGLNDACAEAYHSGMTIEELVQQVGSLGADLFSNADIIKGFWQIPLEKSSQSLTQFSLPGINRSYAWTSVPMGLASAPFAFWTLINAVVYGLSHSFAYMDDLLTASKGEKSHLEHLEKLFRRMIQHKLTLNIEKCTFMQEKIHHLGFELSKEGVRPGKQKVDLLLRSPPPSTITEVKSFLGLSNFFYRHFPFQSEAKHLSALTRKGSGWKGGELPPRALLAFQNIKKMLTTRPLLRYPDYNRPFHLYCDAATGTVNQMEDRHDGKGADAPEDVQPGGIGCFLGQEDDQGRMHVIGFAGRGLKKNEEAYSSYLLEHLSACYALDQFDHVIRGKRCYLYTDHHPLTHLSNMHKKTLMRLQEMILERDVRIVFQPGPANGCSDFLSRIAYKVEEVVMDQTPTQAFYLNMLPYSSQEMRVLQRADSEVFRIIQSIKEKSGWKGDAEMRKWGRQCVLNKEGVLFFRDDKVKPARMLLVVPKELQNEIMQAAHDGVCSGHAGIFKTQSRVRTSHFWPSMLQDVADFVLSCDHCQKKQSSNYQGISPIIPLPAERQFGGRVHIDLLGELSASPTTKWVMVATDSFTKFAEFIGLPDKKAETVANHFWQEWILRYGVPIILVSDGGKEFKNKLMARLAELLGMEHRTTSPFHPACNSQAEVLNRTAARYIRAFIDHDLADVQPYLAGLRFSYNTSVHKATGTSPYQLMFGRLPRYPFFDPEGQQEMFTGEEHPDILLQRLHEARKLAAEHNMSFREAYTHKFNSTHGEPDFEEGQLVLLHAPLMSHRDMGVKLKKFGTPWIGPAKIKKLFPDKHNALIQFPPGSRKGKSDFRVHFDRLKKYIARPGAKDPFQKAPGPEEEEPSLEEGTEAGRPPVTDSDDPMLGFLAEEEEDLLAWNDLHSSREEGRGTRARLKVKFNPTSTPISPPSQDQSEEPEEMVDVPRLQPPSRAPTRAAKETLPPPPRARAGPARFTRARAVREELMAGLRAPFRKKWI